MPYELSICDVQRATVYTPISSKARPRTNMETGTVYTDYATKRAEADIREQFSSQTRGASNFDGPVKLEVAAYRAIRPSSPRKLAGAPNTKRPDGDNVLKLVCDALNHIAWIDDSQVYDQRVIKMPFLECGERERLEIVVVYYKVKMVMPSHRR